MLIKKHVSWSEDEGITIKKKENDFEKSETIEPLIGKHRQIYDDISGYSHNLGSK